MSSALQSVSNGLIKNISVKRRRKEADGNMEVSAINSTSNYLQLLVGLLVVIALIFLLAWLAKKYSLMAPGMSGVIRVVSGVSLGNRDRLILVEVAGRHMLLGASPGRINTLHVFDADSESSQEELNAAISESTSTSTSTSVNSSTNSSATNNNKQFSRLFSKIVAGGNK